MWHIFRRIRVHPIFNAQIFQSNYSSSVWHFSQIIKQNQIRLALSSTCQVHAGFDHFIITRLSFLYLLLLFVCLLLLTRFSCSCPIPLCLIPCGTNFNSKWRNRRRVQKEFRFFCELQNELNFHRKWKERKNGREINGSHIFDHSSTPITTKCSTLHRCYCCCHYKEIAFVCRFWAVSQQRERQSGRA